MRYAVNNFQKTVFILLLFASTFSGFLGDIALSSGKTMLYVAFDGLIIFLALMSLGFLRGKLILVCIVHHCVYRCEPVLQQHRPDVFTKRSA
jgi:hypothetical protein